MSAPLVECIPNFSEARRPEVVAEIIQAVQQVPGVSLIDHSSDLDHNRTVLTLVGEPAAVEEAAYQAIATAAALIDMTRHTGGHPRIGATDVVPFVPIRDITMAECVQMARRLGQKVAGALNIPVYLYEEAAQRPDRRNLEDIRRGQYEGLKAEIATNPDRAPDYGPAEMGSAGATVIGARPPLVAFNVYLTTDDVGIAKKIAQAVRHSSGGYAFVKGMGILVNGRAQVSMNMTNYTKSPLHRVIETIRREAQRYGVGIHHSELIGMIPQQALIDTAVWYTQLDDFSTDQILERKLETTSPGGQKSTDFLDELASGTPTPGGGSAAAHTGAAAAALVTMVARLTVGKKKYAAVENQMLEVLQGAEGLRARLTAAVTLDSQAFDGLMAAIKLPKVTPEEQAQRAQAIEKATFQAAAVPLDVAGMAVEIMALALAVVTHGNLTAISDGGSAGALAKAALTCASYNVRINLLNVVDQAAASQRLGALAALEDRAAVLEHSIEAVLAERGRIVHPPKE